MDDSELLKKEDECNDEADKEKGNPSPHSTEYFKELVFHSDNLEDFKREVLSQLRCDRAVWREKISEIISESGSSRETFAALCGVSRQSVAKWCNGSLPSSRDDYIRIGFAANYTLSEMNAFLKRYGRYPELYAKSLEDTVYIYALNSSDCPHTYDFCRETIAAIKARMESVDETGKSVYSTVQLSKELSKVRSLPELVSFIESNAAEYRNAYAKLYAYVEAFLAANSASGVEDGVSYSVNFLANEQGWTSSLRQCVSAIRQKKWFPLRRKVIALGLHLNMTTEQINEMLGFAKMEPLYLKNPVEAAIVYAVEDADVNDLICCDGGMELCEHVRETLEELEIADIDLLLNDLTGAKSDEKTL